MIYLNNAATSYPKPQSVCDAVSKYLQTFPYANYRTGFEMQGEDVLAESRKTVAGFFDAQDANEICFSSGATESLNLAITGLISTRKHAITTTAEHNSVLRPLKLQEKEAHLQLTLIPSDKFGRIHPEDIAAATTDDTRYVVVTHCSNVTGELNDVAKIAEIAHRHGAICIVDASQSAGCIPISVQKLQADILVFAGHKSLWGIPGIGGFYLRQGLELKPLKVGGTGIKSDLLSQPDQRPWKYEAGTINMPGIVSLKAGIEFIQATGMDVMARHKQRLYQIIIQELGEEKNIVWYGRREIEGRIPIFCFNIAGLDVEDAGYILAHSYGCVVRTGLHCAPLIHQQLGSFPKGLIRVSPSYFTTEAEIREFCFAIKKILQVVN